MDTGNVLYARQGNVVVLRFVGKLGFAESGSRSTTAALNAFLKQLFEAKDFENILLDLTEATSIDSTTLGLMAKITKFSMEHFGRKTMILSMNENIDRILESVGFDRVFVMVHEAASPCPDMIALPAANDSDREWISTVLTAHQELCRLNERNYATFKCLVEMLEKETAAAI